MNKHQFSCTLLSDIIINQTSGSKEKQATMDFLPGNVFLGIAAGRLYGQLSPDNAMVLFHSGRVRFGDAHPLSEGIRSLRIPAALYYKKDESLTDGGGYVMYNWTPDEYTQPKQCRNGFYIFTEDNRCSEVKINKSTAIKSAYDSDNRRSKYEAMYAYESLRKGLRFAFEIEYDDDVDTTLIDSLVKAIVGKKHAGHSKSAQYGLVEIRENRFTSIESQKPSSADMAVVYADSRLIFIDGCGMPTFQPTAHNLGFESGAEIDWQKSQLRTFRYAPWNAKRQTPDTDRCGIEKGSVFVIKLNGTVSPSVSRYIGSYNCEGFGHVIYNPAFLDSDAVGKSILRFIEKKDANVIQSTTVASHSSMNQLLLAKLDAMFQKDDNEIYKLVNGFVQKHKNEFRKGDDRFASQWGYIRDLAENCSTSEEFKNEVGKYLDHGVAEEKWRYKKDALFKFIEDNKNRSDWSDIMINLTAEMAKQCKR